MPEPKRYFIQTYGRERLTLAPLVLDPVEAKDHANSLVAVSRTASNQRRQPCVCTQRSLSRPFGFSRKNTNAAHSSSDSAPGYNTGQRRPMLLWSG